MTRHLPHSRVATLALASLFPAALLAGCPAPPPVPDDVFGAQGEIVPYASAEQRETFRRGREVAQRRFGLDDGLGPHFNVASCTGCHERPTVGGSAPRYRNFLLAQNRSPDGVQMPTGINGVQPQYEVTGSRFATPEDAEVFATRSAIPFFGTGLIAEIDGAVIMANADPDDEDGDGISGRVNFDQGFVGRFGRKSQTVSVEGFIRGPLFNHLGITSDPLTTEQKLALPVPSAVAPPTRTMLTEAGGAEVGATRMHQVAAPDMPITDEDEFPDPELSTEDLFDLVSFAMLLAAPVPDEPTETTEAGHSLFDAIGCVSCHRSLESPRGTLPLYSDLLVHDMGEELADSIQMGIATGSEFRTQPLWGVASTGPYLHDGRADTLEEAILLHGGEAKASRDEFAALDAPERGAIVAFLESLGGRSQATRGLLPPNAPIPRAGEYGAPRMGADPEAFVRGRELFDNDFGVEQGLGPRFNGDSCRACHFDPVVGGAGPIDVNVTRQLIVDGDTDRIPTMGTMAHRHEVGAVRPPIDVDSNLFEMRQTPSILGLGVIDQIPDAVILANADPDDADGDGISGRAHVLQDGRLGRLGWKANVPDLREFARDAMFNEVGVTLPEQAGLTFGATADDDEFPDPEISLEDLELLTRFMADLAPPPRSGSNPAREGIGEAVFNQVGCGDCHMNLSLEDGRPVPLYSDLLLHDVMPPGARGVPDGDASGRELRTPPLWGIATTAPYMHDGRSGTVEQAIAAHFSEAQASADAVAALSAEDRGALIAFLESL